MLMKTLQSYNQRMIKIQGTQWGWNLLFICMEVKAEALGTDESLGVNKKREEEGWLETEPVQTPFDTSMAGGGYNLERQQVVIAKAWVSECDE